MAFTIPVAATPEALFALQANGERIPEWFPGVRRFRDATGPLDLPGARYVVEFGPLLRSRCEVTRAEPPGLHERSWDARPLGSSGVATVRFERAGEGSELHFEATYRLPFGPLGRLADRLPAARRAAERSMRREVESFKALVEREQR